MNYLLDTHAFLWSIFSSDQLSKSIKEIVLNSENNIFVSVITFWEISLKYNLGKIQLDNILPDLLPEAAKKSGFDILQLNEEVTSTFYKLPKISHSDPFDRLLIWQSIRNNLIIISKDKNFQEYSEFGLRIIW